jgi:hypothetical protein
MTSFPVRLAPVRCASSVNLLSSVWFMLSTPQWLRMSASQGFIAVSFSESMLVASRRARLSSARVPRGKLRAFQCAPIAMTAPSDHDAASLVIATAEMRSA